MASDFSAAWQCLSKRTIGFSLRIKLHACFNEFFKAQVKSKMQAPVQIKRGKAIQSKSSVKNLLLVYDFTFKAFGTYFVV
jgi:hypothetical protein